VLNAAVLRHHVATGSGHGTQEGTGFYAVGHYLMIRAYEQAPAALLAPWAGAFGGTPPFDQASVELLTPALETAMAEALASVDTIAGDPAPATFDNVIAALERSGRSLSRA